MGYSPLTHINPCPVCQSICGGPQLRRRWRWKTGAWLKLECACGVAGAWQKADPKQRDENVAADGWAMIAGRWEPKRPPPPMPSKK